DCNYLLDYYRLSADRRLIFGGGVVYGARDPANIEALIRPKLARTFPALRNVRIDYAWTGNFLLTLSRLPQVGRLGDNIYYSQGCSGHGVTYTHVAGKVLAEAIRGQAERFDAFAALPHYPFPGGRLFRVPFTALGAWYYQLRDRFGVCAGTRVRSSGHRGARVPRKTTAPRQPRSSPHEANFRHSPLSVHPDGRAVHVYQHGQHPRPGLHGRHPRSDRLRAAQRRSRSAQGHAR